MKDFLTTASPSNENMDEMGSQPDQETAALPQPDTYPVIFDECGKIDLIANTIKLPLESSSSRKVLKSSAVRASGQFVFGTNPGRLIQLDSYLEYKVALILSVQPELADLHDQVCFNWLDHMDKSHRHFFDFVTTSTSGERTAVIVKEASRLKSERLQHEIKLISTQAVLDFVDRVIVVTQRDIDQVDLHNAKLLHEVRHADPEADRAAERVIVGLIGAATISDLTTAINMGSRGFRALARLIRSRSLELLKQEILSYKTMVRRGV